MGLNDHLEDGAGCMLSLGSLDLNYLHVDGGRSQAGRGAADGRGGPHREEEAGGGSSAANSRSSSTSSSLSISSISINSNCSEESSAAASDSDDERRLPALPHRRDLGSAQSPSPRTSTPAQPPTATGTPPPADSEDYRAKVDFALKLGYPEELVLLVLRKLGPGALINDLLGELVKLGTSKTETEQQAGVLLGGGGLGGGGGGQSSSSFSALSSSSTSSIASSSSSSLDSCRLLCPSRLQEDKENLRPVVVDGSNVAMSHGNKEVFSCQGIQLAVDWFLERGHRDITVFVPAWRKEQSRPDALITDQEILRRLEKDKLLVFTPSRRVQGRRVVCYDDRFIVKLAYESDGIIVSNDNYRDLANEKPEWKKFIDERLLMYSFVNDKFMPPDDPLGRHGPSLENFLRKRPIIPEHKKQPCPYGKKCTYGHKCKFYHPERGSQPMRAVADELRASVRSSSSAKSSAGDSLAMKSLRSPKGQTDGLLLAGTELGRVPSRNKLDPGLHGDCFGDFLEDRLGGVRSKSDARRGSSSSSSSCNSSIHLGHHLLAPGGPTMSSQERWDQQGGDGGTARVAGQASGPAGRSDSAYSMCESPELDYSCLIRAYSGLSLVVPQSPERFFPADLRAGSSLASDCSSEGSVSSDSFSPDPLVDDRIKCHRHSHHHRAAAAAHSHHHHLHCPKRCSHPPPPSMEGQLHGRQSYAPAQTLRRLPGFGSSEEEAPPPASYPPHPSSHPFQPPPASFYPPPHPQHSSLSSRAAGGYPRDYPAAPPHPHTPQGHSLLGSHWQDGRTSPQDSRLYEGSPPPPPPHARRDYGGLNQHHHPNPHPPSAWETPSYQQPFKPFLPRQGALPEGRGNGWHSLPWGRDGHSSPRGQSTPPQHHPHPHASLHLSHSPHANSHAPAAAMQRQESPNLGRYQDLRENVFFNLCNIFPQESVRAVMSRHPHVTDAQQLAAAILMEKSQQGY